MSKTMLIIIARINRTVPHQVPKSAGAKRDIEARATVPREPSHYRTLIGSHTLSAAIGVLLR